MKKMALVLSVLLMPISIGAFNRPTVRVVGPTQLEVPAHLSNSGHTSVVQWGCPVMEVIPARSQAEAIKILSEACMNEARKEVVKKPGVFDVIKVSVVWPDVNVSSENGGYLLKGTFFLETLVFKSNGGK